jgi:hypothetical protein
MSEQQSGFAPGRWVCDKVNFTCNKIKKFNFTRNANTLFRQCNIILNTDKTVKKTQEILSAEIRSFRNRTACNKPAIHCIHVIMGNPNYKYNLVTWTHCTYFYIIQVTGISLDLWISMRFTIRTMFGIGTDTLFRLELWNSFTVYLWMVNIESVLLVGDCSMGSWKNTDTMSWEISLYTVHPVYFISTTVGQSCGIPTLRPISLSLIHW